MRTARIFSPAQSATTSGAAKVGHWVLEFDRESPRTIEPLMGYTSSRDMLSQVRLKFDTAEDAVAYAEREGIAYRLEQQKRPTKKRRSYSDNFSYNRSSPWTH